jgi:replication factor A1
MEIEFAPHVEEIKRALDNEIEDGRIKADLQKLLEFRVPIAEAKRSIIKKYGGAEKSTAKKLNQIEIGERNIEFTAQVLEISKKTINVKNVEKTVFSGVMSDETTSRGFTAWEDFNLNVGDVIKVTQAYVRNWHERPEMNFGNKSIVTKLTSSIQIKTGTFQKKLCELKDGEINIQTIFTVQDMEMREINTKDGTKKIMKGIAADEDTKLPLTSWVVHPELVNGNTILAKNAYLRSFRGIPSLNIGENSIITKIDTHINVKEAERIMIGDLIKREGAYDVMVEGNVLSVRPGSGLISRCPDCNRVVQKSMCRIHGKVDEKMDMRIKAIIDDGTGALTLVLDSRLTQELCGYSIEKANEIARAAMSTMAVEEEIKKRLVGKMLAARGNMSKGEYGVTLVAAGVSEPEERITEKAITFLEIIKGEHG